MKGVKYVFPFINLLIELIESKRALNEENKFEISEKDL